MAIKIILSFTIVSFFGSISSFTVDISIQPKFIRIGEDLLINCTIVGDPIDKIFKTFLKCPFHEKETICINNCDSLDICTNRFCNRKMVGNQSFQCYIYDSPTTLIYSYRFFAISHANMRNLKQLPFTCTFKDKAASGFADIVNRTKSDSNPTQHNDAVTVTPTILERFSTLKLRDLILIGLVLGLFVSFLINVWCGVQWCIRHSRNKNMKKKLQSRSINQNYDESSNCYEPASQYNSRDNIKRVRSHQTLPNYDRSIPLRSIPSSANHSTAGSVNNRPKYRNSTHTVDEYDMNHGSNNSLLIPAYGQKMLGPIQYIDPSMFSYMASLSQPYSQQIPIHTESIKSQNNFDALTEPDISEFRHNRKKTDEMISDRDSVFN